MASLRFWKQVVAAPADRVGQTITSCEAIRSKIGASLERVEVLADVKLEDSAAKHALSHLAFAIKRPPMIRVGSDAVRAYASSWTTRVRASGSGSLPMRLEQLWSRATAPARPRRSMPLGDASWLDQFVMESLCRGWRPTYGPEGDGLTIEVGTFEWTRPMQRATIRLLDPSVRGMLNHWSYKPWFGTGLSSASISPFWSHYFERRWVGRGARLSHYLGVSALVTVMRGEMRDYVKRLDLEHGTHPRQRASFIWIDDPEAMSRLASPPRESVGALLEAVVVPTPVLRLIRSGRLAEAERVLRRRLGGVACNRLTDLVRGLDDCDRSTIDPDLLTLFDRGESRRFVAGCSVTSSDP